MSNMSTRRRFIGAAGIASAALVFPVAGPLLAATKEADVGPTEDLMREHGVLSRILLVYEESQRRFENGTADAKVLSGAADLISRFIEHYHEKIEEDQLFPRFEKAGKLVDLVKTLRVQHEAGRGLTTRIQQAATAGLRTPQAREQAQQSIREFIRMYRPHKAREDTVLFPALHTIVSAKEFDSMGDQFEAIERKTFGGEGFEMAVDKVSEFEKALGINDLAQFTPSESTPAKPK